MDTEQLTALRAGPPFLFVLDEVSYAALLYVFEIVDHAHAVFGPVALIEMIQPVAGKCVTGEAVPGIAVLQLIAGLDPACDTGLWFPAVVAPATGAWLPISRICDTETTVHSTGSDQSRSDLFCHSWLTLFLISASDRRSSRELCRLGARRMVSQPLSSMEKIRLS